jgi:hypothetical protein
MKSTFLLSFLFVSCTTNAQHSDSVFSSSDSEATHHYNQFSYSLTKNKTWALSKKTLTYENQGLYHSTYLALNDDSTFVFYSIFEVGYYLSTGNWKIENKNRLKLSWDKLQTTKSCNDENIYRKYSEYHYPMALPINDWNFIIKKGKLKPVQVG